MTLDDCYDALGLVGPAGRREIQRAYKRLVLKYHPDRCGDDKIAGERFRRATEAYAILKRLHDVQTRDGRTGPCAGCERIDFLLRGIHGKLYCAPCLLGQRRRLLPLPIYKTIRCLSAIGLQTAAIVLLIRALAEDSGGLALVAGGLTILSLGAIAWALRTTDVIEV